MSPFAPEADSDGEPARCCEGLLRTFDVTDSNIEERSTSVGTESGGTSFTIGNAGARTLDWLSGEGSFEEFDGEDARVINCIESMAALDLSFAAFAE